MLIHGLRLEFVVDSFAFDCFAVIVYDVCCLLVLLYVICGLYGWFFILV